jgi:hypothetical protein
MKFLAFIMHIGGDIDEMRVYDTEQEADAFGQRRTSYHELDPRDDPAHWEKYDPPVVILFEAENSDAFENGKYKRPVAVYQRGEKHICIPSNPNPIA